MDEVGQAGFQVEWDFQALKKKIFKSCIMSLN